MKITAIIILIIAIIIFSTLTFKEDEKEISIEYVGTDGVHQHDEVVSTSKTVVVKKTAIVKPDIKKSVAEINEEKLREATTTWLKEEGDGAYKYEDLKAEGLNKIRNFSFEGREKFSDVEIQHLLALELYTLYIYPPTGNGQKITGEDLAKLRGMKSLSKISLRGVYLTDYDLEVLVKTFQDEEGGFGFGKSPLEEFNYSETSKPGTKKSKRAKEIEAYLLKNMKVATVNGNDTDFSKTYSAEEKKYVGWWKDRDN